MKRRNREINIFSMSALDLFASALGAFILIAIVLFPFFPNTAPDPERLRAQLAESQAQLQQCEANLTDTQQALEQCTVERRKRFVLMLISWSTGDDVDLHIIDPNGREFYFDQKTHAGTPAKLEEDNTRGPGNEIWLHPEALPGDYQVYYRYYAQVDGAVTVRGAMLTPNGREPIPDRTLYYQEHKPRVHVATITVNNAGVATLYRR